MYMLSQPGFQFAPPVYIPSHFVLRLCLPCNFWVEYGHSMFWTIVGSFLCKLFKNKDSSEFITITVIYLLNIQ